VENTSHTPTAGQAAADIRDPYQTDPDSADGRLLAAVARGDEAAFVDIYQTYAAAIYNYLLRLIHDPALAEDLLQETFVTIWQGASSFKRKSKVKTWMFSIAHNKAVSWLRRDRPETLVGEQTVQGDVPDPEKISLVNWRNQELLNALDLLSPNHRAVIELVFVHEMAYAEIAQIVDCPVGTVKSRVSYALRNLNRFLSSADVA